MNAKTEGHFEIQKWNHQNSGFLREETTYHGNSNLHLGSTMLCVTLWKLFNLLESVSHL